MNELVEGVDDLVGRDWRPRPFGAGWADDTSLSASLIEVENARRRSTPPRCTCWPRSTTRNLTDDTHGLVTSTWLSRDAHLPRPKCTRMLRFARALERFDQFDAALTKGEIGIDHLRVVVDLSNPRIVDAMVELQDLFLSMIPGRTFARWETEVRNIAALLDHDGSHDPESDITANRFTITAPGPDSARLLNGQLVGSNGETVHQVLDHIADELASDNSPATATTTPTSTSSPARCCSPQRSSKPAAAPWPAPPAPPRHPPPTSPSSSPPSPTTTSTPSTSTTPTSGVPPGSDPTQPTTPTPKPSTASASPTTPPALLCCDPALHAVIVDTLGRPLDLGHAHPLRHPRPTPSRRHPRRRLRLPRLRSPRRPGATSTTSPRSPTDPPTSKPRLPLPPPPPRHPPPGWTMHRHPRRLVPVDNPQRTHHLEPTPPTPTSRTHPRRMTPRHCLRQVPEHPAWPEFGDRLLPVVRCECRR